MLRSSVVWPLQRTIEQEGAEHIISTTIEDTWCYRSNLDIY